MALGLSGVDEGGLIDLFEGEADLAAGIIRVLHDGSFGDDPTRIFRAVRYEQRLGFHIEEHTLHLLREALGRRSLSTVTGDRLRHELERILDELEPWRALMRARELGVLTGLYPALGNVPYLPRLEGQTVDDPLVYLAAVAYGLHPVRRAGFVYRLNMPSPWSKVVTDAVALHSLEEKLSDPELRPLEICHHLDPLSPVSLEAGRRVMDDGAARDTLERYLDELRDVRPLLNGDDLLLLGIPEGPQVGEVLRMLREARLEGRTTTRHDEVALVREFAKGLD
jgi:tRNA nucleotidyltransferase (CCA-adding enzyme)